MRPGAIDLRSGDEPDGPEHRASGAAHHPRHHHRRNLLVIVTVSAIAMIPWIVNLATSLPRHYEATHWRLAWVGFDVVLLAFLAATAWLGWHRRQLVLLTAFTTGVLLCGDAWFDITTADPHDRLTSVASAFVEIPLAILLFRASWRLLRLAATRVSADHDDSWWSVWRMPILGPAEPAANPASLQQSRFADPCAQTEPIDPRTQTVPPVD